MSETLTPPPLTNKQESEMINGMPCGPYTLSPGSDRCWETRTEKQLSPVYKFDYDKLELRKPVSGHNYYEICLTCPVFVQALANLTS